MYDALDDRLGDGLREGEFGSDGNEHIDDGMYDALDDRLGDALREGEFGSDGKEHIHSVLQ